MRRLLRAARGDMFRSFAFRNFRLFFSGQLISQVGNWLTTIAQTLLVLHLGGSGLAVGLLAACQFLPVLLIGAWTGLVADRSDKRRLLLIVQALAMVQSFVLAALAFTGDPPLWSIYLVAGAGGILVAFDNPARRAFVVEMVPDDHVNNAVSLNSALMTGSRVIGPALAGLLIHLVGYGWTFALDGLSYAAVLAGLWAMNPAELRRTEPTPKAKGQVRAGLRYVASVHDLWVPLTMIAIVGTLAFNYQVVMPLFVHDAMDAGDTAFTILFSVLSVGSFIGALAAARRADVPLQRVARAATGFGVALLLLAVTPSFGMALAAALLVGVASTTFMTSCTAIVQVRADAAMRGRVLALQAMLFLGSAPLGGPVLGLVSDTFGARFAVGLGGIAALGAGTWGLTFGRGRTPGRAEQLPSLTVPGTASSAGAATAS